MKQLQGNQSELTDRLLQPEQPQTTINALFPLPELICAPPQPPHLPASQCQSVSSAIVSKWRHSRRLHGQHLSPGLGEASAGHLCSSPAPDCASASLHAASGSLFVTSVVVPFLSIHFCRPRYCPTRPSLEAPSSTALPKPGRVTTSTPALPESLFAEHSLSLCLLVFGTKLSKPLLIPPCPHCAPDALKHHPVI